MTAKPRALILEDARSEREELGRLLEVMGFEVSVAPAPVEACKLLAARGHFDLAVIDWDMSQSQYSRLEPTSAAVLAELATNARDTLTIVHARNLSHVSLHDKIQQSHPTALLHDKVHGGDSLKDRIHRIFSKAIGDLKLDEFNRGHVLHRPSGRVFKHSIGFELLSHDPKPVHVSREQRWRTNGIFRFRRWLEKNGSSVRVKSLGGARYRLIVIGGENATDDR